MNKKAWFSKVTDATNMQNMKHSGLHAFGEMGGLSGAALYNEVIMED